MAENSKKLKNEVRDYWDNEACGTWFTDKDKYTKEYFEDIEKSRYEISPEILPFARFNDYPGKKLLEVGVGAGTDFLQWVRGGTKAYTIPELKQLLNQDNVEIIEIKPVLTYYDKMLRFNKFYQTTAKILAKILGGDKAGWFLTFQFRKK